MITAFCVCIAVLVLLVVGYVGLAQRQADAIEAALATIDAWRKANEEQREKIVELRTALTPFALFASSMMDRDDSLARVVKHGHQSVCVGAFQEARRVLMAAIGASE